MEVVSLTKQGARRVLNGYEGMTLEVLDHAWNGDRLIFNVRCPRYPEQVWTLGPGDYAPPVKPYPLTK